jgi:hypothetical protein
MKFFCFFIEKGKTRFYYLSYEKQIPLDSQCEATIRDQIVIASLNMKLCVCGLHVNVSIEVSFQWTQKERNSSNFDEPEICEVQWLAGFVNLWSRVPSISCTA